MSTEYDGTRKYSRATSRAVLVNDSDLALTQSLGATRLGDVRVTGHAWADADDCLDECAAEAADVSATLFFVDAAGTSAGTTRYGSMTTTSHSHDRYGNSYRAETTTPASDDIELDFPYGFYDVCRLDPTPWPELPSQLRPQPLSAT